MSYLRKNIAWLLVFAILIFSLCAPAFATADPPPTDSRGNFYDWALRPGGSFGGGIGGGRFTNREDYDKWVESLPAPGYNSVGCLIWQPTISDCVYDSSWLRYAGTSKTVYFSSIPCSDSRDSVGFLSSGRGLFHKTSYCLFDTFDIYFKAPIDGSYSVVSNEPLANATFVREPLIKTSALIVDVIK